MIEDGKLKHFWDVPTYWPNGNNWTVKDCEELARSAWAKEEMARRDGRIKVILDKMRKIRDVLDEVDPDLVPLLHDIAWDACLRQTETRPGPTKAMLDKAQRELSSGKDFTMDI